MYKFIGGNFLLCTVRDGTYPVAGPSSVTVRTMYSVKATLFLPPPPPRPGSQEIGQPGLGPGTIPLSQAHPQVGFA
jgi:hypothetical protein